MSWGFVNYHTNEATGSAANIALTAAFTPSSGETLTVFSTWGSNDITPTITDTVNTYTQRQRIYNATNGQGIICWVAENVANSSINPTVSFSPNSPFRGVYVARHSGLAAAAYDTSISNTQGAPGLGTDAVTSTALTAAQANSLLVGFSGNIFDAANVPASGTGFTSRGSTSAGVIGSRIEDKNVAAGSTAATFTATVDQRHLTFAVVLKEVAAGGPGAGTIHRRGGIPYMKLTNRGGW